MMMRRALRARKARNATEAAREHAAEVANEAPRATKKRATKKRATKKRAR